MSIKHSPSLLLLTLGDTATLYDKMQIPSSYTVYTTAIKYTLCFYTANTGCEHFQEIFYQFISESIFHSVLYFSHIRLIP